MMVWLDTQNIPETYITDASNCFQTLLQSDTQKTVDRMWKDAQQSMLDVARSNVPCE